MSAVSTQGAHLSLLLLLTFFCGSGIFCPPILPFQRGESFVGGPEGRERVLRKSPSRGEGGQRTDSPRHFAQTYVFEKHILFLSCGGKIHPKFKMPRNWLKFPNMQLSWCRLYFLFLPNWPGNPCLRWADRQPPSSTDLISYSDPTFQFLPSCVAPSKCCHSLRLFLCQSDSCFAFFFALSHPFPPLSRLLQIVRLHRFLSAAQPTDQGEESVVLLLVVVVGGGTPFFSLPWTVFWGVKRQKLCLKRGVKRQNFV